MYKKVLKENKDDKEAFKNLKGILKEFDVLHEIKHPCICKAIGMNTSEPVKDDNLKSDKKNYNGCGFSWLCWEQIKW